MSSASYDVQANNNQMSHQANQTLVLDAKPGHALGSNGETRAYGKAKVDKMGGNLGVTTSILFKKYQFKNKNGADTGYMLDPEMGGDRGMITRQVASYEADRLLGLNAVSEEKYGVGSDGKFLGISVQADGVGVTSSKGRLDIDYSDPRIQRGLSDLEVSDFIMGQVDRHSGNIFIDPTTGKVTGIDNDMALPEVPMDEVFLREPALKAKAIEGMPKRMHEDTAKKILGVDPEALRKVLSKSPPPGGSQPLSKAAVDGAVDRLKQMQKELKKGSKSSIQVVKAFDKNTYDAAIREQIDAFNNDPGNLRSKLTFDDAIKQGTSNENWSRATSLRTAARTSALGSIELSKNANNLAPEKDRLANHQDAPSANKVHPRDITDPQQLMAQGYRRMSPTQQKAFDKELKTLNKLETKLEEKEKHLAQLAKPNVLNKLAGISQGGIKGMRQKDNDSINQLKQDIAGKLSQLTQSASDVLPPKPVLNQSVHQGVQQNAPRTTVGNQVGKTGNRLTRPDPSVNRGAVNTGSDVDSGTIQKNNAVIGELNKRLRETNPELTKVPLKPVDNQPGNTTKKSTKVN